MALPNRHAYEVIRENEPCKCYWDVEYYSSAVTDAQLADARADNATLMRSAAASIIERSTAEHGAPPELIVLDGSRPTKISTNEAKKTGVLQALRDNGAEEADDKVACYKFSFHIVLCSVAFASNTSCAMKGFVDRALPRLSTLGANLRWRPTDTTETAPDHKVYGRRQNFRMLGCSKRGSDVVLRHVPELCHTLDPLAACLTHIKPGTPIIASEEAAKRKREASSSIATTKKRRVELPFPIELLQELLIGAGDSVSTVSSARRVDGGEWQVQCDQKKRTRPCLINPTRSHESNNCILFVKKAKHAFSIKYHCTGGECAKSGVKLVIGEVRFDQGCLEWACDGRKPQRNEEEPTRQEEEPARQEEEPTLQEEEPARQEESTEDEPRQPEADPEDPDTNTYDAVKERIERTCFKVASPFCYAKLQEDDFRPQLFSAEKLRQYFANVYFYEHDSKGIMCKVLFINRWMGDVHIREVTRIVCDPQNKDARAYNMWKGFVADSLPPIAAEMAEELMEPIVHHISRVMTNDNDDHTDWVLDYLANMIQRPYQKTQVAISLFGKQGCGKGILFDFFRTKVLGENCSKQTSNPMADLFGGFASGLVNSVLVQIDEITNLLKDKKDSLKDLITSDKVRYEQKGKDAIVVQNLSNLVFTSNNENALSIAPDDRRFVLFKCSGVYTGNTAYFQNLATHLARPEVPRAMYQFLMARDLSRYPFTFQPSRPKTAYYKSAQMASIPVLMRFLSAIADDAASEHKMSPLYAKYTAFYNAGNYKFKYILTLKAFASAIEAMPGIAKRRIGRGVLYNIDAATLRQHLQENNEYDEDAALVST